MAKPDSEMDQALLAFALLALTFIVTDLMKQLRKLREANEDQAAEIAKWRMEMRRRDRPDPEGEQPPDVLEGEVIEDEQPKPTPKRPRAKAVPRPTQAG